MNRQCWHTKKMLTLHELYTNPTIHPQRSVLSNMKEVFDKGWGGKERQPLSLGHLSKASSSMDLELNQKSYLIHGFPPIPNSHQV